jgi:hypothetical protein
MAFWLQSPIMCGSWTRGVPGSSNLVVTVDAGHPWVDTGLTVRKGDRVSFVAAGTIQWGAEPGQVAGPEGHDGKAGKLGKGGLIGRVGMTGKPFAIGGNREPFVMPKNGELVLASTILCSATTPAHSPSRFRDWSQRHFHWCIATFCSRA